MKSFIGLSLFALVLASSVVTTPARADDGAAAGALVGGLIGAIGGAAVSHGQAGGAIVGGLVGAGIGAAAGSERDGYAYPAYPYGVRMYSCSMMDRFGQVWEGVSPDPYRAQHKAFRHCQMYNSDFACDYYGPQFHCRSFIR